MSTWQPATPPPGERDPRKLSEILDRTTRRLGGPSSGTASTVFTHWDRLVGPDIAAHARPESLHDGVLVLAVDHPAWATQLRYMTADLLTRIAAATGGDAPGGGGGLDVTDIRLRVVGQPPVDQRYRGGRKPKA